MIEQQGCERQRPRLPELRRFLRAARAAIPVPGEVAVRLIGDEAMRAMNASFRGQDRSTDVLAFAEQGGGDIAISLDTAARQARARRHDLDTEVRILLLHGMLHLAGYDHHRDHGEMAARELTLRRQLGLPAGLIERAGGEAQVIALAVGAAALWLALVVFTVLEALFGEQGRIREREFETILTVFETEVSPRLGLPPERAAAGAAVWVRISCGLLGGLAAVWVVRFSARAPLDWLEAALVLLAALALGGGLVPSWLLHRSSGRWLARLTPLVRAALWLTLPLSLIAGAGRSLATLAVEAASEDERRESDIEALVEAGQDEGIIEPEDRQLVQSALEFGDKRVRDVMVPRPAIVAAPASATLAQLRDLFAATPVTHLPVYGASLDEILGMASMRDLWRTPEAEWPRQTIASRLRPMLFIPEAATALETLREMQRRRLPMAVVVDEYGSVAGLVTTSDLLEPLVGELPPEAAGGVDPHGEGPECVEESPGQFLLPGGIELEQAEALLGIPFVHGGARTLGGYLTTALGRIPAAGERLRVLDRDFEVLEADPVRIKRLRVRAGALP